MVVRLGDEKENCDWKDVVPRSISDLWISVIVGNSNYSWALCNKSSEKPVIFWRTPPLSPDELGDPRPMDVLSRHLPSQAHTELMQMASPDSEESEHSTTAISVYVVSTNKKHEEGIKFLFSCIPSRIFRLENTDFYTREQGCYETFGADRAAALYGAKYCSKSDTVMVFDGGTAWTYTGLARNNQIMGGGIAPGLGSRFRCLADYCGDLPHIDYDDYKEMVGRAPKSLPVFAKDTRTAMVTAVFQEIANQSRSIVKHFLRESKEMSEKSTNAGSQLQPSENGAENPSDLPNLNAFPESEKVNAEEGKETNLPEVFVTGGDSAFLGKLLKEPGTIVPEEPDALFPYRAFKITEVKHIGHYGVGALLQDRKNELGELTPDELLRSQVIGQRVAKYFDVPDVENEHIYRGTVVSVLRGQDIESDLYQVIYDDGDEEQLTLDELYASLLEYSKKGEKSTVNPTFWSESRKEEAAKLSGASAEQLAKMKPKVTEQATKVDKPTDSSLPSFSDSAAEKSPNTPSTPVVKPPTAKSGSSSVASRKRAGQAASSPKAKKSKDTDTNNIEAKFKYMGFRVAKKFEGFADIYFGTVVSYDSDAKLWKIVYDDDDEEEFDEVDLKSALKFIYSLGRDKMSPEQSRFVKSVLPIADGLGASAPGEESETPVQATANVEQPDKADQSQSNGETAPAAQSMDTAGDTAVTVAATVSPNAPPSAVEERKDEVISVAEKATPANSDQQP
mmetsp:Transcript_2213/g.6324  ORF Transcript_2213/g.6324 Transcript_2213/m.6324 type:complete len:734 (+) Transcript_2213:144-2345(+)